MNKIKDLTLCSILLCLLFVQEQALMILPNIQFTGFLLVLYSKSIGFKRTILIIFCHTLLDCLFNGSFNPITFPFMLMGWAFIPIIICRFFKNENNPLKLSIFGFLQGFVYSWLLIPSGLIYLEIEFLPYLIQDIPWEIILATSNALAILWLYNPLSKLFNEKLKKFEEK